MISPLNSGLSLGMVALDSVVVLIYRCTDIHTGIQSFLIPDSSSLNLSDNFKLTINLNPNFRHILNFSEFKAQNLLNKGSIDVFQVVNSFWSWSHI